MFRYRPSNAAWISLLLFLAMAPNLAMAQVAWVKGFDDALKQAAKENKFIVLDISASWCPACKEMDRTVYTDKEFIKFSKSQVFIKVIEDTSSEGKRLARKFQIEGTPTLIVLDSSGKEVDRILGGMEAGELIEELKEIIQSAKSEKYTI